MIKIFRKTLSVALILAVAQLSFVPASQAFWGQNFWSNLSANIFSLEEDLPSGLFFDWEKSLPEGAIIMAYQNSENLGKAADSLLASLERTIEAAAETEEGLLVAMMAGSYLEMAGSFNENLDRVQSLEMFIQYDLDKLKAVSQDYEELIAASMGADPLAGFESLGMCLSMSLVADADVINLIADELPAAGGDDINFSVRKQADSLQVSLGCAEPAASILPSLPETVNFVIFQSGMDLEGFYEASEDSDAMSQLLFGLSNKLREINAQRVIEDLNAGAFLLSIEPGGYKTQLVASLKTKSRAELLKRYWSGGVLKAPFFMNEKAQYDTQLLEFSGEGREYVFLEERFSELDWTHWYGKMQETSMAALPVIAVMGVVAATTMQGYLTEARGVQSEVFIRNTSTVLKTEMAVDPNYIAPTSKEELEVLLMKNGMSLSPSDGKICNYYVHSLNKPKEFAVFSSTNPVTVDGSEKMRTAISKIFSARELSCEAPQIQGTVLFKISE